MVGPTAVSALVTARCPLNGSQRKVAFGVMAAVAEHDDVRTTTARFGERQDRLGSHRRMLSKDATTQVSQLDDLVTMRIPTRRAGSARRAHARCRGRAPPCVPRCGAGDRPRVPHRRAGRVGAGWPDPADLVGARRRARRTPVLGAGPNDAGLLTLVEDVPESTGA